MNVKEIIHNQFSPTAILLLIVGAVAALIVWFSWPTTPDTAKLIREARQEVIKEYEKQLKTKDATIKSKDARIKDLDARIVVSKGQYDAIRREYEKLRDAQANIQPAKTNQELRDRFTAAGFVPVPADQHRPGLICFPSE